ncbi:hypothetical protein HAX54_000436 [Datura stramonium]|uniref:Uncharacterized protein n=1 Tax=Datura stramonium TaxID=4076 RepID=A0ABS8T1S9_DATST|nr:hypothetical protein [Datura stramonium]
MLVIADDEKLEEKMRGLVVEFVLSSIEAKEGPPGMISKLPSFTNTCITIFLKLLLDITDKSSWNIARETEREDAGQTRNCIFGKRCLCRFSVALGGMTIAPTAVEQLDAYSVATEWEKRHAALIALVQIAKGSSEVMTEYVEQLVNMVLHSFQDPHPRVRWAAINAIYKLSTNFCPDLQEQYHNQVLPALAAAMDDFQSPRVQARAASTLLLFCGPEML